MANTLDVRAGTPPAAGLPEPGHDPARGERPLRLPLVLGCLLLALLPLQLDGLVAATAMPTIAGDLGGFDRIAWIATAYLLAMAVGTIAGGRLGDMFGRRRMLLVALGVFLAGSAWAGISTGMTELVLARGVQGLGGGIAFTTLLATVADIAPPEKRGRYQGMFGALAPVSMILGPWVGGVITEHLGWRWIFLLNLPLVGLAMLGVIVFLHLPRRHIGGRVDVLGLVAAAAASSGAVLAVSWGGQQYAWDSWQVLTAAAVAVAGVVALFPIERRAEHPLLPPALFQNRSVVLAVTIMAIGPGAVMMGSMNYLTVFLQVVQGHTASNSGLLLLPMLLPAIAVAILVGRWTTSGTRFRVVLVAGTAAIAVSSALLATMGTGTSSWTTTGYMLLAGAGMGLLFQTPLVLVQNASPAETIGAATGAASFLRSVGGAVGVGGLGALFASRFSDALNGGGISGVDVGNLSPGRVARLPLDAQAQVAHAAASANSALFVVAAVLAAASLVAALALPRLRADGADRVDEAPEVASAP